MKENLIIFVSIILLLAWIVPSFTYWLTKKYESWDGYYFLLFIASWTWMDYVYDLIKHL